MRKAYAFIAALLAVGALQSSARAETYVCLAGAPYETRVKWCTVFMNAHNCMVELKHGKFGAMESIRAMKEWLPVIKDVPRTSQAKLHHVKKLERNYNKIVSTIKTCLKAAKEAWHEANIARDKRIAEKQAFAESTAGKMLEKGAKTIKKGFDYVANAISEYGEKALRWVKKQAHKYFGKMYSWGKQKLRELFDRVKEQALSMVPGDVRDFLEGKAKLGDLIRSREDFLEEKRDALIDKLADKVMDRFEKPLNKLTKKLIEKVVTLIVTPLREIIANGVGTAVSAAIASITGGLGAMTQPVVRKVASWALGKLQDWAVGELAEYLNTSMKDFLRRKLIAWILRPAIGKVYTAVLSYLKNKFKATAGYTPPPREEKEGSGLSLPGRKKKKGRKGKGKGRVASKAKKSKRGRSHGKGRVKKAGRRGGTMHGRRSVGGKTRGKHKAPRGKMISRGRSKSMVRGKTVGRGGAKQYGRSKSGRGKQYGKSRSKSSRGKQYGKSRSKSSHGKQYGKSRSKSSRSRTKSKSSRTKSKSSKSKSKSKKRGRGRSKKLRKSKG